MPDFADAMYEKASSFGRDVFHYVISGTVFVLVCSVPLWPRDPVDSAELSKWESTVTDVGVQLAALFVAAVVLFCLGHMLFCVGFWIRNKIVLSCNSSCNSRWDMAWHHVLACLCCCHSELRKNKKTRQEIEAICTSDCSHLTVEDKRDVHVGLEMVLFDKRRQLHANYVERYNTLWHLRLGLAASLLCAGPIGSAIGFCWGNFPMLTVCVAVVAISGGLVLLRQHLVTNTNFLRRIVVAFRIVQQEEQQPDGQRQ